MRFWKKASPPPFSRVESDDARVHALRPALERRRPPLERAHDAVLDGEVVLDDVELGDRARALGLREDHAIGAGHAQIAPAGVDDRGLGRGHARSSTGVGPCARARLGVVRPGPRCSASSPSRWRCGSCSCSPRPATRPGTTIGTTTALPARSCRGPLPGAAGRCRPRELRIDARRRERADGIPSARVPVFLAGVHVVERSAAGRAVDARAGWPTRCWARSPSGWSA